MVDQEAVCNDFTAQEGHNAQSEFARQFASVQRALMLRRGTGERMKKILLGTSAAALASAAATSANAAKWDLKWTGFYEADIAFSSTSLDSGFDGDFDGIDVHTDSEIIFKPSITLDNGLKFGVDIQLEGNTGGDQIDESFVFIKGSFGEVLIGSENSAGYKQTVAAPDVTWININSGSLSSFVPVSSGGFRTIRQTSFLEVDGNNDAQRLTYFTPRFSGFQLGASYARDAQQDSGAQVNEDLDVVLGNIFDISVNYTNNFGGFDVAASARYGTGDAPGGNDPDVYSFGLNLGAAGFTVGGSYAAQDGGSAINEGDFFDVGISYGNGPWAASATFSHSDYDGGASVDRFLLGATYKLGPGVKAGGYAAYVEEDDVQASDVDGFIIGTGFKLNF